MVLTMIRRAAAAAAAFTLVLSGTIASDPAGAAPGRTVQMPPTIDRTGRSDVTSQVQAFLDSVPDGATITFPPRSTYRIEGTVMLIGRKNLTIDGAGATFTATTDGAAAQEGRTHTRQGRNWPRKRSHFLFDGGRGHLVKNLHVAGPNKNAGAHNGAYVAELEAQHGVEFWGTTDSVLEDCHIHHTYGDLVSVTGHSASITVRGCSLHHSGRQGVTVDRARRVTIDRNSIADIGRSVLDLEPARSDWTVDGVTFTNNRVGSANGIFVAALGKGPVDNVNVSKNVLTGEHLKVFVRDGTGARRSGWVVAENTSDVIHGSPKAALRFVNVDRVRIIGNRQRVASTQGRSAVELVGTANATVLRNDFPIHDTRIVPQRPPTGEQAIITVNGSARQQPVNLGSAGLSRT